MGKSRLMSPAYVLGIETSCDETAVGIIRCDRPGTQDDPALSVAANVVYSQLGEHKEFGGVVPEIAARAHLQKLPGLCSLAFREAGIKWAEVGAIGVTAGPGLMGGVIVGVMAAKAMAAYHSKPLYAINHLEGHALSPRMAASVSFPYLLLLVSGGHTQFILVRDVGSYHLLGTTLDDAIGEAFDKTAKLLGLPFPGGPHLEKCAQGGDPLAHKLPLPLARQKNCNFSLSGLKTAVAQLVPHQPSEQQRADIAASFQHTVGSIIEDRLGYAIEMAKEKILGEQRQSDGKVAPGKNDDAPHPALEGALHTLVVAGGVAANHHIRARLQRFCRHRGMNFHAPPLRYCTDNGAMIAWAAAERWVKGWPPSDGAFAPRPRWPLNAASYP